MEIPGGYRLFFTLAARNEELRAVKCEVQEDMSAVFTYEDRTLHLSEQAAGAPSQ